MAQDWDIKLRSNDCRACSKAFKDNQVCFSELVFGENGYQRDDYCEPCWETHERTGTLISTWQGRYQAPPPKPEEPLKHETAESLLRRLMEDDNESNANVIFILAVMLERKKILVEQKVETYADGGMVRLYEHRKTGETFLIPEPMLRLDQLEQVQTEVVTMLGGTKPGTGAKSQEPEGPGEETRNAEHGAQNEEATAGEEPPRGAETGDQAPGEDDRVLDEEDEDEEEDIDLDDDEDEDEEEEDLEDELEDDEDTP